MVLARCIASAVVFEWAWVGAVSVVFILSSQCFQQGVKTAGIENTGYFNFFLSRVCDVLPVKNLGWWWWLEVRFVLRLALLKLEWWWWLGAGFQEHGYGFCL